MTSVNDGGAAQRRQASRARLRRSTMESLTLVARFVVTPEQRAGGTDYLSEAKLILFLIHRGDAETQRNFRGQSK